MAYLAAISTATTIPLFIRTKGDLPQLSFPVVGSLSSVHLYANNMKTALHSCSSAGSFVTWKCFHDCVTLILVSGNEGGGQVHPHHLLELLFGSLVLLLGQGEVEGGDTETLKRSCKCCYPLLDSILEGSSLLSPLTQCLDVMVSSHKDILLRTLEAFTEAAQSNFGCLTINGRVCVATDSWWDLSSLEKCLLSLFVQSLPPSCATDIPVYLPHASNRVPHRLLTFTLLEGVLVSVLCNPKPPLSAVQELVSSYWSPVSLALRDSAQLHPTNVPPSLKFEVEIEAFLLVNLEVQTSLTSLRPLGLPVRTTLSAGFQGEMSQERKLKCLSRFFRSTVDNLLPLHTGDSTDGTEVTTLRGRVSHKILETYTHAKVDPRLVCVLCVYCTLMLRGTRLTLFTETSTTCLSSSLPLRQLLH
ncbi:protein fuzzy homolog isoform X2 [Halichondria panicea]|uniref:protein fuzzy homolog isoform X2 n=1 Tax=Halichondria panicea TaxID=6063 RepID=UPI00312B3D14